MVFEIILGRAPKDTEKLGTKGAVFVGKQYVTMGKTVSLANKLFFDVSGPHVILVAGKRGSGKSYTLGVLCEGMSSLPEEVASNIAVVIFDTMGIYWTTKYPNYKDDKLLDEWDLTPKGFIDKTKIYMPEGYLDEFKKQGIPADDAFTIACNDLSGVDWSMTLGLDVNSDQGVLIGKTVTVLKKTLGDYDLDDMIKAFRADKGAEKRVVEALVNKFESVKGWGLFYKKGTPLKKLIKGGIITVIDLSMYAHVMGGFSIRALVIALLSKKLLEKRMISRKLEEIRDIEKGWTTFKREESITGKKEASEIPLVWLVIDEAHEFLPREGETIASGPLIQVIREGRQPGLSLILATQQPGKIHTDVITQCDIVLSHRLTAKLDMESLNNIMQSYLAQDLSGYMNMLPKLKGAAIVLDDKLERIYPLQMRPRITWHGGGEPSALKK